MNVFNRNRIVIDSPNDETSSAYLKMSEKLKFYAGDDKKVILFMSTKNGDGKSTVATNVAISLAKLGGRVVYLDADFENPSINETFDMQMRKGVSDAVLHDENISYMIYDTSVYGLSIIFAGLEKDETGMVLLSNKFRYLTKTLKHSFDFCILDINSSKNEDVYLEALKDFVDGVVLVDNRSRDNDELDGLVQLIEKHEIKIIGIVNNLEKS
ncbi:CpsD/CapB family tyrosine-protein kinase [Phocicoccus pinnipedialis]|uniref:Tyrosine-protein kinase YwqD n=1 Tax=Phocicoccus pinnipedialis TaxID=110845 RepID=A0A6V7R7C0_9BACL|nr:CpsD/CapB family tyrosine-protein kinase [Jeotgalicoccus pinnipedialis]MBP1938955.1 capsular exopolysaccharide synthesis family protein [Jeotgalicoccus pinnipedialis]CAD2073206.1 Tyrosine-protein kinase YwqD [Jeotgalicoccus pinnipedialis]